MLYLLADALKEHLSFLNAFTYLTTRAGLALLTAFVLSVAAGPRVLDFLRALKVGQFIKKDHVESLHALHKGKGGTPTMGGLLIVLTTTVSLLLWGRFSNRLLIVAMAVFLGLGFVGFLDDYIKLRRKHNDGLSARAKFLGQILVGGMLGFYVVMVPITYGAYYVKANDVTNWDGLMKGLVSDEGRDPNTQLGTFGSRLTPELVERLRTEPAQPQTRDALLTELNAIMEQRHLYSETIWASAPLNGERNMMLAIGLDKLTKREVVRLNRLMIEAASNGNIVKSPRHLQTKVAVPGLKDLMIPLGGLGYIAFVVLIIVSTSNCVNLTDGLDGLAAGASVVSVSAFTAVSYVVSRADWSSYLFITYIPEAGELTVFGAAVLGAGLGFLWFNAHPAEVFMGDTGSLALGGVLGAFGVLTKQELLIPIVGGLFVLEGLSVVIQVGSFKLRGKRVFKMSPLHHHFELLGWSETKVVVRFWILAFVFALLSLATLKLR
jgi:UDP-N-acetylmuramyl pentapeptide phosphotransferase/UDP-N-acetylglucosamine-1-phosphate transferase